MASETGEGPRMESVEMCVCPVGYAGTSCEVEWMQLVYSVNDAFSVGVSGCVLSHDV